MIALYVGLGLTVAGLLALAAGMAATVDDWSRDLWTNVAATSAGAADPQLRPIQSPLQPSELAAQTITAAQRLPRWQLAEQAAARDAIDLHFVRTTGLWKFKDDIRVRIEPHAGGSLLTAQSRSRVGKGDLGQNPRNLKELLDGLRSAPAK
jgi:uncharacterized protein (DUF1499 family)